MKTFLLLTDLFGRTGGIQTFNRCLVKALDELSKEVSLNISAYALNDTASSLASSFYIASNHVNYKGFSRNKLKFAMDCLFESLSSDVIFLGHVNFLPLLNIMSIAKGSKRIFLITHGIEAWKKFNLSDCLAISKLNKIITVSNFTKDKISELNNTLAINFFLLYNTLDPQFISFSQTLCTREQLSLPNGHTILTVSRLEKQEKYKNIETVISYLPSVLDQLSDTYYVIVGDGSNRKYLEELAYKTKVRNNVIFTGEVPAKILPSYYNSCDVLVLPSTGEGFGITFLEAMHFGKPCIGANAGAIPEVIEDGKTGLLVNPNDKEMLIKAIVQLLKNNNLAKTMGQAGNERLERKFSFERFKGELKQTLCQ